MIAPGMRRRVAHAFLAIASFALLLRDAPLRAASESGWVGDALSKVRLIAGTPPAGQAFLRAGVEIKLAPGWKTYWRYPGDSGIPPRFDFTRSANVRSVEIAWPAPVAWRDDAGASIGYKEAVVFPLRVVAENPAQPVELALAIDYAICERVCVPVSGQAQLVLSSPGPAQDAALRAAEERVPKKAALGEGPGLAIRSVEREGDWPSPRILVEVAGPAGASVDLFAEGPNPDWALPVPEPAGAGRDGAVRFAFVLDGVPPGTDPRGATLTLTAVAGGHAIEVPYRLD